MNFLCKGLKLAFEFVYRLFLLRQLLNPGVFQVIYIGLLIVVLSLDRHAELLVVLIPVYDPFEGVHPQLEFVQRGSIKIVVTLLSGQVKLKVPPFVDHRLVDGLRRER